MGAAVSETRMVLSLEEISHAAPRAHRFMWISQCQFESISPFDGFSDDAYARNVFYKRHIRISFPSNIRISCAASLYDTICTIDRNQSCKNSNRSLDQRHNSQWVFCNCSWPHILKMRMREICFIYFICSCDLECDSEERKWLFKRNEKAERERQRESEWERFEWKCRFN